MKGRPDCPRCQGQGLIFDPDPQKPVLVCGCTAEVAPDAETLGLPARYREADFARFWKWWNNVQACHARALLDRVADLEDLLARPAEEVGELEGREELVKLLAALKRRPEHGIRPAGADTLFHWAANGKHKFRHGWELWWIHGPAQSGRSTLAAAALRAWTERTGRGGRFVPVRTLSQSIKDVYHDIRSYQNQTFQSVRDLIEPLQDQPLLVLDDWDRMDSDLRVAQALAQLLDHRYSEELPTILTSAGPPEALDRRENHPLARLEDSSLLERLRGAERVEMVPALKPWIERMERG
ncbi:NACHT domain-containing protein [Geothrix oryzisoli]|uniref:NACHT domain-containing protein n=1 Tax=Geothrix oryzisoli TaxID=2922721 RepID=UPI001FABD75D|nr:NACHT domain-containing protein [Geothrix oryzisoli]